VKRISCNLGETVLHNQIHNSFVITRKSLDDVVCAMEVFGTERAIYNGMINNSKEGKKMDKMQGHIKSAIKHLTEAKRGLKHADWETKKIIREALANANHALIAVEVDIQTKADDI